MEMHHSIYSFNSSWMTAAKDKLSVQFRKFQEEKGMQITLSVQPPHGSTMEGAES